MMEKNIVAKKERNNVIYLRNSRKELHKIENKKKIAQNISMLKCLSYGSILILLGGVATDCNIYTNGYQITNRVFLYTLLLISISGGVSALFLREVKKCLELM